MYGIFNLRRAIVRRAKQLFRVGSDRLSPSFYELLDVPGPIQFALRREISRLSSKFAEGTEFFLTCPPRLSDSWICGVVCFAVGASRNSQVVWLMGVDALDDTSAENLVRLIIRKELTPAVRLRSSKSGAIDGIKSDGIVRLVGPKGGHENLDKLNGAPTIMMEWLE